MDNNVFSRGSNHILKMLRVRRWCTVTSPLTWPSTNKSVGAEELEMKGSVDGCSVLPETQFVRTCKHVDTTLVSYVRDFRPQSELSDR